MSPDEMPGYVAAKERLLVTEAKLRSAVEFIQNVAAKPDTDHTTRADAWLQANGFECEATRRKARERRAAELDAEIARLRAEREKL